MSLTGGHRTCVLVGAFPAHRSTQVMETVGPHVRTIPVRCAPSKAPCPRCGKLGHRKAMHNRQVRTIAYKQVVFLDVTYGEYRAHCHCCTTFRTTPPGVEPRALYDNKVREAVLDRILSDGFVYDCLDWQVRRLDRADHRRWVLDHFSGTLCVDELHLGQMTLLLATDPLNDLPVAFALVASNDQPHMRRFFKNLKTWGLSPAVVVTDGSNLYPTILAKLWPDARHQLCVFHVLKDLHEQVLDAVRRQRRAMSRRGNRQRQRGRRPKGRAKRQGLTTKEKSSFVHRHRHLIVKRWEKMTRQERIDLVTMQSYLPELKVLRDFVDRLEMLFEEGQSEALAWGRHTALVVNRHFLGVPELATALELLAAEKFVKMITFLKSQVCQRVRTNNHVERVNRKLRYEEKSRYKWRTRHTMVRFLVLLMDRYWRRERAIWNRWPDEPPTEAPKDTGSKPARKHHAA